MNRLENQAIILQKFCNKIFYGQLLIDQLYCYRISFKSTGNCVIGGDVC